MPPNPVSLDFQSGIQRDGTTLDSTRAIDALWTRWRLQRPRKIGGFVDATSVANAGVPRRVHCFYTGPNIYVHFGSSYGIWQVVLDRNGVFVSMANRTPPSFPGTANLTWTIDALFDTTSSAVQIIAHAAPDALLSASSVQTTPYIGILTDTNRLVPLSDPSATSGTYVQPKVAGGVVCVQPFLFDFDINGLVQWSAPNLPEYLGITGGSTGAGQARISAQKVVAGIALRGGGAQSPAALFWTLSELISAVFIGAPAYFAFNTVSPSSSILSGASVIEYDSLYFWAGVGRFLVFNGTVEEVPNNQNQDWFFNNLTLGYEAKTFAVKVPRYGEIWWCACMFGATEPNYAVIYNLRENAWYDTALPTSLTAGFFAQGFKYPIMMRGSSPANNDTAYMSLYENGVDAMPIGSPASALRSYYETPWIGGPKNNPASDAGFSYQQLEPDFVQLGEMMAQVIGAGNMRSSVTMGPVKTIPQVPDGQNQQLIGFKQSSRLGRLHIESNVLGGSYISGRHLLHGEPAELRQTQ